MYGFPVLQKYVHPLNISKATSYMTVMTLRNGLRLNDWYSKRSFRDRTGRLSVLFSLLKACVACQTPPYMYRLKTGDLLTRVS